jgi:hypothetical protein
MRTKHIIVTRLAIKWVQYKYIGLSWAEWLNNSIELMDKYCRASLRNQSCQDFTLFSIVDESVIYFGRKLNNEKILYIPYKIKYPFKEIVSIINNNIEKQKFDSVIITRLDRDDCLRYDFVENLQKHFADEKEKHIDLRKAYTFDSITGKIYNIDTYNFKFVSPFVSTFEIIKNGKIKCIPYAVEHTQVSQKIKGNKVDDLFALQVLHGNNICNKIVGKEIDGINIKDYGIV